MWLDGWLEQGKCKPVRLLDFVNEKTAICLYSVFLNLRLHETLFCIVNNFFPSEVLANQILAITVILESPVAPTNCSLKC